MNKISLMTMSMLMQFAMKYMFDHDKEDFEELYLEMMDIVAASDFDAVDITSMEADILGADRILEILKERKISVSSYVYLSDYSDPDPAAVEKKVADMKRCMDDARKLGTDVFMCAVSAMGPSPADHMTKAEVHAAMAACWKPIVEYAGSDMHVVIEDTPALKFYLNSADDLQQALDLVPGAWVVYDSGNLILTGGDPVEYYKRFASRTAFLHLKDMAPAAPGTMFADVAADGTAYQGAPVGRGILDMKALLKAVRESGYTRGITVEYNKHPDMGWVESLNYSKHYYEAMLQE